MCFIALNISTISLTLFFLLFTTSQCLPQLPSNNGNNNNIRRQEGNQNNNRNQIPINRPLNSGQRVLEGGFRPSNFGNELVRFPDNVARPVGGRQPQRSPFRNSSPASETTLQNNRRPIQQIDPPERPRRPPTPFLPAIPITSKFIRPHFDILGVPLNFGEIVPEEDDVLPDFRGTRPASSGNRNREQNRNTARRPNSQRPQNSNLGPDLRPRLPLFGRPELILKATEELRNSDVNQNSILPTGFVNAGVLPLASESEESQQLGFFPPFNKPKRKMKTQPK